MRKIEGKNLEDKGKGLEEGQNNPEEGKNPEDGKNGKHNRGKNR